MSSPSNLVVLYQGQRKTIKIASPNALLQTVMVEAAQLFGLDSSSCVLRVKKTILDCSQPIRFCSLSNNSQLELEVSDKGRLAASSSSSALCKIAISVQGGGSMQGSFPPSSTFLNVLEHFIAQHSLPADALQRSPQIVYLRSTVTELGTSLASLGLAGQAVRMQLRLEERDGGSGAAPSVLQSAPALPSAPSASCPASLLVPTLAPLSSVPSIANAPTSSLSVSPASVPLSSLSAPAPAPAPAPTPPSLPIPSVCLSPAPMDVEEPSSSSPPLPLAQSLSLLLSQNFDAVSSVCLVTIGKYLGNAPRGERYRQVKLLNPLFRERVLACRGALEVLRSVGFEAEGEGMVYRGDRQGVERSWGQLEEAWEALGVEREKWPKMWREEERAQGEGQGEGGFDPFRSLVVRTAPQPPRMESAQERELKRLEERRREIEESEGGKEGVKRCTTLYLPPPSSSSSAQKGGGEEDRGEAVGGSATSLPSSFVKKALRGGEVGNDPLTTFTYRALQRCRKEVVYPRTLVRVSLPDRRQLHGYFSPFSTISDVYAWVRSCLVEGAGGRFELFTSPPRCVLKEGENGKGEEEERKGMLQGREMVPCAVMYLSWREGNQGLVQGEVLRGEVLERASASPLPVPGGVRLVEEGEGKGEAGEESVGVKREGGGRAGTGGEEKGEKGASSGSGRPKWFKI